MNETVPRCLFVLPLVVAVAACDDPAGEFGEPDLTAADLGEQAIKTSAEWLRADPYAAADFIWTPRALDVWLRQPAVFLPGTRLLFAGVRQQSERRDLIAFLLMTTGGEGE